MRKGVTDDPKVVADVLTRAAVLHLALTDENGPHCVAVNFALEGRKLYVHSGLKGRKAAALLSGRPMAFAAEVDLAPYEGITACKWGYHFKSVQGRGLPRLLEDLADKRRALKLIVAKYTGNPDLPMDEAVLSKTALFEIAVAAATARVKD